METGSTSAPTTKRHPNGDIAECKYGDYSLVFCRTGDVASIRHNGERVMSVEWVAGCQDGGNPLVYYRLVGGLAVAVVEVDEFIRYVGYRDHESLWGVSHDARGNRVYQVLLSTSLMDGGPPQALISHLCDWLGLA
jgi:hypothetical protein